MATGARRAGGTDTCTAVTRNGESGSGMDEERNEDQGAARCTATGRAHAKGRPGDAHRGKRRGPDSPGNPRF